jgi:Zn-finger nucleic acid-binding protein
MNCPDCKQVMVALELAEVEIDYCPACGGVWLDAGELDILMGHTGEMPDFVKSLQTAENCAEKPIKCPICARKMTKVAPPDDSSLILDTCPAGEGVWLNKGELESVLELSKQKDDSVIGLLKDIFGTEK